MQVTQTQAYLDYTFKPHLLDFIYIKDNIERFLLPNAIDTAFASDILHPKTLNHQQILLYYSYQSPMKRKKNVKNN